MTGHEPSNRHLLLAIQGAVLAGARRLVDDRDAAAMLASANIALNVLLQRGEHTLVDEECPPFASLVEGLAHEAAMARERLGTPPRIPQGSAIDMAALTAELKVHMPAPGGVQVASCKRLSGGFSRETVAFQTVSEGRTNALILRRQRPDGLLDGIGLSVAEEFPLLRIVHAAGLPVPEPLWLSPRGGALGDAYSVSRHVAGKGLGTSTGAIGITEENLRALAELLGRVHGLNWRLEASTLLPLFGFREGPASRTAATIASLDRWIGYRQRHALRSSWSLAAVEEWLRAHVPESAAPPCLVHGDVGYHNILFDSGRVSALLDWEMASLGSPAKDLAQIYKMVCSHTPWDQFMRWYVDAGGENIPLDEINYFQIFAGFNYLLVCEVARQSMLSRPDPDIAYVDLAFPARAHFYQELLEAAIAYAPDAVHGLHQ